MKIALLLTDYSFEYFTVDYNNGVFYLQSDQRDKYVDTSDINHQLENLKSSKNGLIFSFQPGIEKMNKMVLHGYQGPFHPHGLDFFENEMGKLIYVINHRPDGDFIEVFQVVEIDQLKHLRSMSHRLIKFAQHIRIVSRDEFYVTVWDFHRRHLLDAEDGTNVLHCEYVGEKTNCRAVFDGSLVFDDFDTLDNKLYVVIALNRLLQVYDITPGGDLLLADSIPTHSICDNIQISQEKEIILTCHPRFYDFVHHRNPNYPTTSQILHFKNYANFDELFLHRNFTCTSAASYSNKIYITSRMHKGMLKCAHTEK